MIKAMCFTVMLSVVSFAATAGCDGAACSGKISSFAGSLKVTPEALMIAVIRGVERNALSCELIGDKYIAVPIQRSHADTLYPVLLTAFAANAQVNIELNTASKHCEVSAVELIPAD